VRRFGGSISAEYGVGTTHWDYLGWSRSKSEIALMRSLNDALGPEVRLTAHGRNLFTGPHDVQVMMIQ
jgi:FAD/FMN-containing dehydrogenase